ncbi:MAG: c-type cytochrome [Gammaproteobacteria bacterium]|jgi:hypothetical protein|nr:c-type cytochrome [Gammaproteobacteria bacterium]
MLSVGLVALISTGCFGTKPSSPEELPQGKVAAGWKFYRFGLNRNNKPTPVSVQGDVQSGSDRFACADCHRPSGFGGSEGGEFVPIITQPVLFSDTRSDREKRNRNFQKLFKDSHSSAFNARVRMPRMRPAYTEQTLASAIRLGVDPAGQKLSGTMPRYQLDEQTMADLIAYLKTLSVQQSPGVTKNTLHLATIVSDGVDPLQQEALIKTLQAFTKWYNEDIYGQLVNPGFSPYYRSEFADSFRQLDLHVWILHGPVDTWAGQLRKYYADQRVFAVVSGMVEGPWRPIDTFCESEKIPCVFPVTNLPYDDERPYGYSIYFSRGLSLEAGALAKYLGAQPRPPQRIQQIYLDEPAGTVPAAAFMQALDRYLPAAKIISTASTADNLNDTIISLAADPADVLVIWPGDYAAETITTINAHIPKAGLIVLPSTALESAREALSPALLGRLRLTYPYEKPSAYHPRKYRVRAWFGSRGVRLTYPLLQLQAFYAMTQMQYALDGIVNDFYRDYLIEFIEHEAEALLDPGVYPAPALGPGQRFASKGAYIIELEPRSGQAEDIMGYHAVSEWVVP